MKRARAVFHYSPSRILIVALVAVSVVSAFGGPASARLRAVSRRVNRRTGFPRWYKDASRTKLRLCIDSRLCLGGDTRPDRSKPASVKSGNLPDEAFYAVARAQTHLKRAPESRIRWRAVLEGAFASPTVRPGKQITFTRVQVVGDKIPLRKYPAGTRLTFETPYGTMRSRVTRDGNLRRVRRESRLGRHRNKFIPPVTEERTGYGPTFLRWDSDRPRGFLGNPRRLHTVKGGPFRNTFQVFEGGSAASRLVRRFEVAGQCVKHC